MKNKEKSNACMCWFFLFHFKVEGLIRLMEGDHVGPFNLGNPGEFTMLELAKVNAHTLSTQF